ncbi:uncharacterized protein LOC122935383 [Bufo gargarizans]|uniref:uncharacterized protein LOC122935383 n=1 Tax=Bufo gargarizans TaxID=30331 RepID=UPI001CF21118|nr:uncharacterized protein LOC122935383 [Bufo gargarizans]
MEESLSDTENLIRLVQGKRCLYDTQDANYKNRRSRQQAWEDIGKSIWPDWSSLTKTVKQGKVNTIKGKWKSLKDAFIRHRRKQKEQRSGSSPGARSSYVHAAQMSFLIPCTEMRSTDSSWEPSQAQADEEEDEGTIDSEPGPSMGSMSPPAPPPPLRLSGQLPIAMENGIRSSKRSPVPITTGGASITSAPAAGDPESPCPGRSSGNLKHQVAAAIASITNWSPPGSSNRGQWSSATAEHLACQGQE